MPLVPQISSLATRMGTECKAINAKLGSLNSLTTTDKTTLVAAINEVRSTAASGGTVTVANISDATTVGRSVLLAADGPAIRSLIGAGTSSLALGTTASTAKAGNYIPTWAEITSKPTTFAPSAHTHTASQISDASTIGRTILTAVDAPAVRTAIGVIDAAEVDSRIQAVVAAAPAALDTLDELAAALGDDPNFGATVTTALGNRVRVDAAQALTGTQQTQARTNIGAAAAADVGNTETDFVAIFEAALV